MWAFREDKVMVTINTDNGIEPQNESLKYQYLKYCDNNCLTGMITILNQEILHNKH